MKTVIVLCFVFAVLRLVLPTHGLHLERDGFKDLAHVFVGGLFGAAIISKQRWLWACAIGLTILEVVAALTR